MKSFQQNKGFTLLELIITLAIMGVVLGVGITSYSRGLQNSRNNRRQIDMEKMRQALERFRSEDPNHSYPASLNELLTNQILLELPRDPSTNATYVFQYFLSSCVNFPPRVCSNYQLSVPLEPNGSQYLLANPNEVRTVNSQPVAPTDIPPSP